MDKSSGISFLGGLTLVFIAAKLFHAIDWSWWWVVSTLLIGPALFLCAIALVFIVTFLSSLKR
jgi:hypothetical protein